MKKLQLLSVCICLLGFMNTPQGDAQTKTDVKTKDRRGPFTKAPRSIRSRTFDTKHIRLELKFDFDHQSFQGKATHRLVPFSNTKQLEFDIAEMSIKKVSVSFGKSTKEKSATGIEPAKFRTTSTKLSIDLPKTADSGKEITVVIDYQVNQPKQGAHFVVPKTNGSSKATMVWTQSEPEYARYWFPCFDSPTDRTTSEIIATVPAKLTVLSNGELVSKKINKDGTQTWHWYQRKPHVSYLFSVVAGDFVQYRQQWDGIPVISYVPPNRLADARRSFHKTPAMLKFFSEKIGVRYPWHKYSQICVDEYSWGGMEHTSATTLTMRTLHDERAHLDSSSDGLVAHELAHQWFGDLMTCKDWAELWLNESFATYFETLWAEHDQGWDEATWNRYRKGEAYFSEDKNRYRRPIVTYRYPKPSGMFDRHTYPKGARVLHMLRYVLGDDMWWRMIKDYTTRNQYGIVETSDLRIAVERTSGQGLNWFFDQWIYHGGHPEYVVDYKWNEKSKTVTLNVKQTQKVDSLTPLFRMPVEIEMVVGDQTMVRKVKVSKAEETFHFTLKQRPRRVLFDPRDWILKKLTFKKSKQETIDQLLNDPNMICRIRAAQALPNFPKDDETRQALILAATQDKFWAVRQQAIIALSEFSHNDVRSTLIKITTIDEKSKVRSEAIKSLRKFKHPETNKTLRSAIQKDPSYTVVSEALKTLLVVDRKNVKPDLLAALKRKSQSEIIFKTAAGSLAKLDDIKAQPMLLEMLKTSKTVQRRAAVISALGKLSAGDQKIIDTLQQQLVDAPPTIVRAVIIALGETQNPQAIEVLMAYRQKDHGGRMTRRIDDALKKLREVPSLDKLKKKVDDLTKKNQDLENRLKKLEKK